MNKTLVTPFHTPVQAMKLSQNLKFDPKGYETSLLVGRGCGCQSRVEIEVPFPCFQRSVWWYWRQARLDWCVVFI